MNWGRSIVVAFVLFASYIGYLVYVCISQPDIFLVEKEYYSSELKFGAKLESLKRGKQIAQLSYRAGEEKLVLAFNKIPTSQNVEVVFYRPSNPALDNKVTFEANVQESAISTENLQKGPWKVSTTWVEDGVTYLLEKEFVK